MEIWDLYDEQGRKTGETWERGRMREIPEGRYHLVCDVLIRHRDGTFLLTLRDDRKEAFPGCWEASAGGAAQAGENPEEAARREMLEETGLTEAEQAEQAELRREYLEGYRQNLKAMLDSIIVEEKDGTRHPLQKKSVPPTQ